MADPFVVTFYSFKGGVGRSMLLANVGAILARRGHRVLLWDLDLEAPGLHNIQTLRPKTLPARGFLEWIEQWQAGGGKLPIVKQREKALMEAVRPTPLERLSILPAFGEKADFADLYYRIDWHAFLAESPAIGHRLFRDLIELLGRKLDLDYLLIDSRTGITDLGGLTTVVLPHVATLVANYSAQNTAGLDHIRQATQAAVEGKLPPEIRRDRLQRLYVASPVPIDEERRSEGRARWKAIGIDETLVAIPFVPELLFEERLIGIEAEDSPAKAAYAMVADRVVKLREAHVATREVVAAANAPAVAQALPGGRTRQGRAFEDRVAELLRWIGLRVEPGRQIGRRNVDLIAHEQGTVRTTTYLVECKDLRSAVGVEEIAQLKDALDHAEARAMNAVGMFVANQFSPTGAAAAKDAGIDALTIPDLERKLFRADDYCVWLARAYEESGAGPTYVAQSFHPEAQRQAREKLLPYAESWSRGAAGRPLWVLLGDYGTGKSTFVRRFGYELATAFLERRKRGAEGPAVPFPIAIDLKEYPNAISLEGLLQEHLRKAINWTNDPQAIVHLVREGRAVLLLDSFDEIGLAQVGRGIEEQFRLLVDPLLSGQMAPVEVEHDEDRLVEAKPSLETPHGFFESVETPPMIVGRRGWGKTSLLAALGRLPRAKQPGSRVLVTCRTALFRDEQQAKQIAGVGSRDDLVASESALGRMARRYDAALDDLALFDDEQTRAYLRAHLGEEQGDALQRQIIGAFHLETLAQRPVLLEIIMKAAPRLARTKGRASAAALYAIYTDEWLETRAGRFLQTTAEQRKRLLEVLAWILWPREGARIHHRELYRALADTPALQIPGLELDRIDIELRTATFLIRTREGEYYFSHRSFLEFFYARHLLRTLERDIDGWAEALGVSRLSVETCDFFADLLTGGAPGDDPKPRLALLAKATRAVLGATYRAGISENALRVAYRVSRREGDMELLMPKKAQLQGAALGGEVLDGAWLAGADLSAADLTEASLRGARLDGADLRGARLVRAWAEKAVFARAMLDAVQASGLVAEHADLSAARLDGADLTGAELVGAALVGAKLSGASLRAARLADADVSGADFSSADLTYATAPRCRGARPAGLAIRPSNAAISLPFGHVGTVSSASYAPDGSRIVTGGDDGSARVWDAKSGKELLRLEGHQRPVHSASYAPDGSRIVTGGSDSRARVWDAKSGKELLRLEGHQGSVLSASYAPDGSRIVTGGDDGSARVWDAKSGKELLRLEGHQNWVWSASYAPDGSRIVTGGSDGRARVWDAKSGKELLRLEGHQRPVNSASYAPDGSRIVTGGDDGSARVWDAKSGKELLRLEGHQGSVLSASYAPDGSRIVTGGDDGSARVWDAKSGKELLRLEGHQGSVLSASYAPDGSRIVTGGDDGSARVWDAKSGKELLRLEGHQRPVNSASYAPDGSRIVTGGDDGSARVWDAKSGKELLRLEGHQRPVNSASYAPDGSRIVTGGDDGSARVWDAKSGKELLRLEGHQRPVNSASYAPNGSRIVTGGDDGSARVWDAKSGKELLRLEGHQRPVHSASYAPDGSRIVTGGSDSRARVWDAKSGKELLRLEGHQGSVLSASYAPDGSRIVTGGSDGRARVWDAKSGKELLRLEGHQNWVWSASYAPDGSRIVTGGSDGRARVWDAKSGKELLRLEGHQRPVNSASYAPDGSRIVTGGSDGSARVWDAKSGKELFAAFPIRDGWAVLDAQGRLRATGDALLAFRFREAGPQDADAPQWLAADLPELLLSD